MAFKENLLKKIQIDNLTTKVLNSLGPSGSEKKVDKEALRQLLEMGPYTHRRERDLDLYLKDDSGEPGDILVLDNEVKVYRTTLDDVVMRKSPLIKEMVSIRNAIKILNDSDVVITRKEASVLALQQECTALLDLDYSASDLDGIAADGIAALENGYADGIIESLTLFADLLDFKPAPKAFQLRHHHSFGLVEEKENAEVLYGPLAIFSMAYNRLAFIETAISSFNKEQMNQFRKIAKGEQKTAVEDSDVFDALKQLVLRTAPPRS